MQEAAIAFIFALLKAGNSIAAKMAMMAMTTSSSISVNPVVCLSLTDEFTFLSLLHAHPGVRTRNPKVAVQMQSTSMVHQPEILVSAGGPIRNTHEPVHRTGATRPTRAIGRRIIGPTTGQTRAALKVRARPA